VRQGMAWAFVQYLHDKRLVQLEAQARAGRVGLWADPEPVAPWVWRKTHGDGLTKR
jgi:micrococcal nuclease